MVLFALLVNVFYAVAIQPAADHSADYRLNQKLGYIYRAALNESGNAQDHDAWLDVIEKIDPKEELGDSHWSFSEVTNFARGYSAIVLLSGADFVIPRERNGI